MVSKKASLKGAEQKIIDAIEEARAGMFTPNRENDEFTRALGNPEHPERTRGMGVFPGMRAFRTGMTTTGMGGADVRVGTKAQSTADRSGVSIEQLAHLLGGV